MIFKDIFFPSTKHKNVLLNKRNQIQTQIDLSTRWALREQGEGSPWCRTQGLRR